VTIAESFGQVDQVMFDEIRDDLVRFEQSNREGNSRFEDSVDAQIRSFVKKATTGDGDIEPLRTEIVTSYLADTACLKAWALVFRSLLKCIRTHASHHLTKVRARSLLDLGLDALETYERIEKELQSVKVLRVGIEAKFKALELFNEILNTSKGHPFLQAMEERINRRARAMSERRKALEKKPSLEGKEETQQNVRSFQNKNKLLKLIDMSCQRNPTLTVLVCVVTA
jgi:hypothetical protein